MCAADRLYLQSVYAYIMEVAKEGVVIEYDLLDQLYAVLKRVRPLLARPSQMSHATRSPF